MSLNLFRKLQEEPFFSVMPESIFNMSRFLLTKTQNKNVAGVSQFTIIYALVKQARLLGANKLVMQLLDRLKTMKIPQNLLAQVGKNFSYLFSKVFFLYA